MDKNEGKKFYNIAGLNVELFLDQDNYMLAKLSKNAGAKIVIHDPYLPPLPDEYGLDMQPNTASSIAVQTVVILQQ
jgi:Amiloride-sensitive sodium channel